MSVRLLSEKHIRAVAPTLTEIFALIEDAYSRDARGQAEVPTKIGVHPARQNSFLHAMPAWVGGDKPHALGMKWVSYFPGNLANDTPDSTGIIILNDPEIGLPCCIMEGMYVTFIRTAACAAVAARYLVPRPPKTLGLIGCGGLGLWSLRTFAAAFPSIERVQVSSKRESSRAAFCRDVSSEYGHTLIVPVEDPADAVRDVDIVISSVPPGETYPVQGDALAPGSLFIPLDVVNSWDDGVLAKVDRVFADSPDHFRSQITAKRPSAAASLKTIEQTQSLLGGQAASVTASERTMVAVCGIASTDVVVGWEIYRRALAKGVGLNFDMLD